MGIVVPLWFCLIKPEIKICHAEYVSLGSLAKQMRLFAFTVLLSLSSSFISQMLSNPLLVSNTEIIVVVLFLNFS